MTSASKRERFLLATNERIAFISTSLNADDCAQANMDKYNSKDTN